MSKVAIVKGGDRKNNIKKVLQLMKHEINAAIIKKKSDTLFIKINTMDIKIPSACTDPVAVEAVLEFFYDRFERIIVGDNSYAFFKYFNRNPYARLVKKFEKVELSNLTRFGSKKIYFEDINGHSTEAQLSLLPEQAFTISLALPKTHDTVIFTGCTKNMVGCIIKKRQLIHGVSFYKRMFLKTAIKSFKSNQKNLAKLIKNARPDLSVLDGFIGMEGDGPLFGNIIKLGIAMCSLNPIAVDNIAARVCGFDNVPYLSLCANAKIDRVEFENIEVLKEGFKNLKEISKKFRPHYLFKYHMGHSKLGYITPVIYLKWFFNDLIKRYYRIPDKLFGILFHKISRKNHS